MFTTFLINLERDTDRLRFMHDQLCAQDISYRHISAIDGMHHTPSREEYDEKKAITHGGRALLPGEIGCALSHARVIDAIVQERIPYALVLEDDVVLPDDFKSVVERQISIHNGSWEYLLFDYAQVGVPFIRQWMRGVQKTAYTHWTRGHYLRSVGFLAYAVIKGFYIVPLAVWEGMRERYKRSSPGPVRFFRPVYFAGAYLITLNGAEKLSSLTHPIVYTADQLPNRARLLTKLKFYGYAPRIVRQLKRRFGSSILNLTGSEI